MWEPHPPRCTSLLTYVYLMLRGKNPSNPQLYPPILIKVNTLNKSAHRFSGYLKTEVITSYMDVCIMDGCYVCDNSN